MFSGLGVVLRVVIALPFRGRQDALKIHIMASGMGKIFLYINNYLDLVLFKQDILEIYIC